MASKNSCLMWGFLEQDPTIINENIEGAEQVFLRLKTVRRRVPSETEDVFETVFVFYDGSGSKDVMIRMKNLKKMDLVNLVGVVNILHLNRTSQCPHCGAKNIKYGGTQPFIYPRWIKKFDSFDNLERVMNSRPAEEVLVNNFQEVSHEISLLGNVVTKPELLHLKNGLSCCKYKLGIDRRYFIRTQPDIKADYPWVSSYGEHAERDAKYLIGADKEKGEQGSLVEIKAYMHNRVGIEKQMCAACQNEYSFPITVTDFIPYDVEYYENRRTDESIAAEEEIRLRSAIS